MSYALELTIEFVRDHLEGLLTGAMGLMLGVFVVRGYLKEDKKTANSIVPSTSGMNARRKLRRGDESMKKTINAKAERSRIEFLMT